VATFFHSPYDFMPLRPTTKQVNASKRVSAKKPKVIKGTSRRSMSVLVADCKVECEGSSLSAPLPGLRAAKALDVAGEIQVSSWDRKIPYNTEADYQRAKVRYA
jgi:hypothetical protein